MANITEIVQGLSNGESMDDQLVESLYFELKKIASRQLSKEKPSVMLNTTLLVHDAWLRLQRSAPERWRDRKQFFSAASEAMRRILVERARARITAKRGGGVIVHVPLDEVEPKSTMPDERVIDVHEALSSLEKEDEFKARIVKLRFFSGMEYAEIAEVLEVNERTIRRHWAVAKVWLHRALKGDNA